VGQRRRVRRVDCRRDRPGSVIATFKEAGVNGSALRLLIESEDSLNDGTAAVAFVATP